MFSIELKLREVPAQSHAANQGWLLLTTQPELWCHAALGIPAQSWDSSATFLVPESAANRAPVGLAHLSPNPDGRSSLREDYRPIGTIELQQPFSNCQLWLPANAEISPALTEQELANLLAPYESYEALLWLPSNGLIGIEREDLLKPTDLVKPPGTSLLWADSSEPIVTIPDRIQAFSLLQPPALDKLFQQEQTEIGGSLAHLSDIDETGDSKPKGVLSKLRTQWGKFLEKSLKRIQEKQRNSSERKPTQGEQAGRPPSQSAAQPSRPARAGVSPLGKISSAMLGALGGLGLPLAAAMKALTKQVQQQREAQIEKLLRLMQKDPDKALQFAIPMNSTQDSRGIASPSDRLVAQTPDFSLSGLFGSSGPADVWDLGASLQQRLNNAYRDQVRREIAAKRYRRAAYIYAHLLGDLRSAADTLEKGQYYNEAAEVFRKLNQTRDVARCLTAAGRCSDAAELYERMEDYVAAGDVWTSAGNFEFAAKCYRKAVDRAIQSNKPLEAAEYLYDKLDAPDEAEVLLCRQWPQHVTAVACIERLFAEYANDSAHTAALNRLDWLQENCSLANRRILTRIHAHIAAQYPDPNVQRIAEDRARTTAAEEGLQRDELMTRLRCLKEISAHDPLLAEDLNRFQRQNQAAQQVFGVQADPIPFIKNTLAKTSVGKVGGPTVDNPALEIHDAILIQTQQIGHQLFVVGIQHDPIDWSEQGRPHQSARIWSCDSLQFGNPEWGEITVFAVEPGSQLGLYGGDRRIGVYSSGQNSSHTPLVLGSHIKNRRLKLDSRLSFPTNSALVTKDNVLWSLDLEHAGVLRSTRDEEVYNFDLDLETYELHTANDQLSWSGLTAVRQGPFFALGERILKPERNQLTTQVELRYPINHLSASPEHTRPRLVAATENGIEIYDIQSESLEVVVQDAAFQRTCLAYSGYLFAISGKELHVFEKNDHHRMVRCATKTLSAPEVAALLPVQTSVVAVIYRDGTVETYNADV